VFRKVNIIALLFLLISCNNELIPNWKVPEPFKGELAWVKVYGGSNEDIAKSIISLSEGGFAVIGNSNSTDGDFSEKTNADRDLFLMKLKDDGSLLWKKTYGGSGDDLGNSLLQTPDGGFVLLGYSNSQDGDVTPTKGFHDNWILKVDKSGNTEWQNTYGFKGHDHAYNVISTTDGGYFFNGFLDVTASDGEGNDEKSTKRKRHGVGEFWCHKLDASGNLEWRCYFGGTSNDRSFDALQTTDGNFLMVGATESDDVDISINKGSYDVWAVMISPKGKMLWEKSFGGGLVDIASGVIEDFKGNFKIVGNSFSQDQDIENPKGESDIFQITIDNLGNLIRSLNFGGSEFDMGKSLVEGYDGYLFLTGYSRSSDGDFTLNEGENDIFLMQIHPNGSVIKSITLGGNGEDFANDLLKIQSGSVLVVGQSNSFDNPLIDNKGNTDIVIAKWK
jgi:hypothetical protein